jgi:hypothetical protein
MKEDLEILLKIFGVTGGLVTAYIFIKKGWKAHVDKRNHFYSGNWNNQGQVTNVPSHYVDIDAGASGNKLNGNFNVRNGNDENSWEMFRVSGKRYFGKLNCKITKMVNGEEKIMATGILKKRKALLAWKLAKSETDQFPKEALLRRGLPNIA